MSTVLKKDVDTPWMVQSNPVQILTEIEASLNLEERSPPRKSSLGIWGVCLMIASFLTWSFLTKVDEITVASGQFVPTSLIKTIQHLDGGIVKIINIEEGQWVEKDQVLLVLDGVRVQSELEEMNIKELSLSVKAERLRAFGLNQKPNFDRFPPEAQAFVNDQRAIFDVQSQNKLDQQSIIEKQIEQQKALLAVNLGQEKDLSYQLSVVQQQRDVNKQLFEKRLKTRTEYLYSEEEVAKVQRELNGVRNQLLQVRQGVLESQNRLVEMDTRLRNDALTEMGQLSGEMAQVRESKVKLQDKVGSLDIKSPTRGIIKGLKVTTIGAVITPGVEILQIVPFDVLEIEAKVAPKDIGNIKPGQDVTVKVSAYDYSRYGGLRGKVKSVSASTFSDEKNELFYKVFIDHINQPYVGKDPQINRIAPGMVVQADIDTGEKTLLQYLIKPVYNAVHDSFRER